MAENEDLVVLDSSDPLNLIINNAAMGDSDPNATPPDWSQLGALWPEEQQSSNPGGNTKQFNEYLDFNMASNMLDMDLDMTLSGSANGIEPSALHLGVSDARLGYPFDDPFQFSSASPADILAAQFPFAFNSGDSLMDSSSSTGLETPNSRPRRLSITSSSSSSGPSFSPLPESIPSPGYLSPGGGYTSDSTHHSSSASFANSETSFDQPFTEQPAITTNEAAQPSKPATSPIPAPAPGQTLSGDPAADLAQRVRQSAGVMLAVPTNGSGTPFQTGQLFPTANALQTKLPIPRLQRPTTTTPPKSTTPSATSSAASTPPPSTPPPGTAVPNEPSTSAPVSTASVINVTRPKTSHTTIERRYRTNLNARIQSLRLAVPALRVLEDRDSGGSTKKIKKNLKTGVLVKSATGASPHGGSALNAFTAAGGQLNPYGEVDVIDERGYVDGVKVARKCSKANVLGKAVEYIRVLKRREIRLRAEQGGLKALVCGLVGGPALLREWEREWRERFGGEERDEVPLGEGDDEGDDEDDDDDDDDDGEAGKKRKRAKVDKDLLPLPKKEPKPASNAALSFDGQPEKRKRGRPRKTALPPAPPAPVQPVSTIATQVTAQAQPQQYLLAVFALFSFFNSPLTSSPSTSPHAAHQNHGHVLSPTPVPLAYAPDIVSQFNPPAGLSTSAITWRDWVQVAHLAITVLLFLSVLARVGSSFGLSRLRAFVAGSSGSIKNGDEEKKVEGIILGQDDIQSFTSALTLYRSLPSSTSPITRALFLYTLASATSSPILMRPILRMRARALWASSPATGKKHQVIFSSTLEDVHAALPSITLSKDTELVDAIAECLAKQRLGDVLGRLFVREVNSSGSKDKEPTEESTEDLELLLQAAKELGGEVASLARNVECIRSSRSEVSSPTTASPAVWKAVVPGDNVSEEEESDEADDSSLSASTDSFDEDDEELGEDEEESQVQSTILRALVLYRSLFTSSSTSPTLGLGLLASPPPAISVEPPTPTTPTPVRRRTTTTASKTPSALLSSKTTTTQQRKKMYALRKLLGSRVFEKHGEVMEDARDRVVDMLVDADRQYLRARA